MIRQRRIEWLVVEIPQDDDVLLMLIKSGFFHRVSQTNTQKIPIGMIFGSMNPAGPVGDKEMNDRFVVAYAKIKSLCDLEMALAFLRHQILVIQGNQGVRAKQNAGIKRGPSHGSDAIYQAITARYPDIFQTRNVFGGNFSEADGIGPDVMTYQVEQVECN